MASTTWFRSGGRRADQLVVGSAITALSSVRYNEAGVPMRVWFAAQETSFGVVMLSCYGDEDKFETAKPQWLDLVKGIVIPKQ